MNNNQYDVSCFTSKRLRGIRVCDENLPAMGAVLCALNEQATTHVFSPSCLLEAAEKAEQLLDELELPKAARRGACFQARSGVVLPKSYKYQRLVNVATMRRTGKNWTLVQLTRL